MRPRRTRGCNRRIWWRSATSRDTHLGKLQGPSAETSRGLVAFRGLPRRGSLAQGFRVSPGRIKPIMDHQYRRDGNRVAATYQLRAAEDIDQDVVGTVKIANDDDFARELMG